MIVGNDGCCGLGSERRKLGDIVFVLSGVYLTLRTIYCVCALNVDCRLLVLVLWAARTLGSYDDYSGYSYF